MDGLVKFRKQIDSIDNEIMNLIEKRFIVTNKVGIYKNNLGIQVNHSNREEDILNKCNEFKYSKEIKDIYKKIFTLSKNQQRG